MADGPAGTRAARRQADRETLTGFRRACEKQSEAIRRRDEWLQDARARLWERTDRMLQAQTPSASAEDASAHADTGDTDAGAENGGAARAEP